MARYIDADALIKKYENAMADNWNKKTAPSSWADAYDCVIADIDDAPAADVAPKSEVEKIFEKLKVRECSNSVCAWCVHATAYGRRSEECDKPYIDKNGKEQKACYVYAKFESLIDNELAELKKKYTEEGGLYAMC